MSGYTVDASALQSTAPVYDAQATKLGDIYSALKAKLDAEGACWGDDDAGKAFAAKYADPATKALNQMQEASTGLGTTAQGVYSWAQNYLNADQAASQDLAAQLGS